MNTPYPSPSAQPYTTEQVKRFFRQSGIPISDWAKANGYSVNKVYQVLNGQLKGLRGCAHEIAVELGLKVNVTQHNINSYQSNATTPSQLTKHKLT